MCKKDENPNTMISFWTIYKYALKIATGESYNKSSNPFDDLIVKRNGPGYKARRFNNEKSNGCFLSGLKQINALTLVGAFIYLNCCRIIKFPSNINGFTTNTCGAKDNNKFSNQSF